MTIRVRHARNDDIPWLLEQLRAFDQFFGAGRSLFPSDPLRAQHIVESLIFQHPFHVALEGEDRVGFIAGILAPHPYNGAIRQLTEAFWWVAPEYRGTRAGSLLLDAFIEEGKQRADWIVMTLEHDSPVHDRVLEKRGFKPKERSFLLEVVVRQAPTPGSIDEVFGREPTYLEFRSPNAMEPWRSARNHETVPTGSEGAE